MTLSDRDLLILAFLYDYRLLSVELLYHLTNLNRDPGRQSLGPGETGKDGKRRPFEYGFGRGAIYKRLRKLAASGLIRRQFLHREPATNRRGGPTAVWSLTSKSAAVLSRLTVVPVEHIRSRLTTSNTLAPFLAHQLGIATFHATLVKACAMSDGAAQILNWLQGVHLHDHVRYQDKRGKEHNIPVYPDAAFALKVGKREPKLYFLEWDRGTVPLVSSSHRTTIENKIRGYYRYRKTKAVARRYRWVVAANGNRIGLSTSAFGYEQEMDPIRHEPTVGFNVLFVLPDRESDRPRIDNALTLVRENSSGVLSSNLIWLTTMSQVSVSQPQRTLSRIWHSTQSQSRPHSLKD